MWYKTGCKELKITQNWIKCDIPHDRVVEIFVEKIKSQAIKRIASEFIKWERKLFRSMNHKLIM